MKKHITITLATVALAALAGCKSAPDLIKQGSDIAAQIQSVKDAEKAEKAKAEADRIAAEQQSAKDAKAVEDAVIAAEKESEKTYNPPTPESFRKAALWKSVRDGGGPGVALIHSAMYNHIVDAYISRQCLKRPDATAAGAMVQASLNIQQGIYPIADRGNGGKVHIRARQAGLSGPAYFIVVDRNGRHYWFAIPDLAKRWGSTHPSDKSPYGGPIPSVGIME